MFSIQPWTAKKQTAMSCCSTLLPIYFAWIFQTIIKCIRSSTPTATDTLLFFHLISVMFIYKTFSTPLFPACPCLLIFTLPSIEVTDRVLLHIINTLFTSSHWLTLIPALLRVIHGVHSCCSLAGFRPTDLYLVMIFFSISNTTQKETAAEINDLASHCRLKHLRLMKELGR